MRKLYYVAPLFLLAACGGSSVKETLGIDRRAPDEFRVVSRPPLSVPPQFDLRPPGIEGVDTQSATRDKAQAVVLGNDTGAVKADTKVLPVVAKPVGKPISSSAAESGFLQKAGAAEANPNVKRELAEKKINEQVKHEDDSWWDRVTTIPADKDPVVKAQDESERLKKNEEEGKPVTEGETPETGGGPVSTLRHWMGD